MDLETLLLSIIFSFIIIICYSKTYKTSEGMKFDTPPFLKKEGMKFDTPPFLKKGIKDRFTESAVQLTQVY